MNRFAFGALCAGAGAICWGFSGTCAQFLFSNYDISTLFITTVRMLLAGLIFLALVALRERDKLRRLLHDARSLAGIALFGTFGLCICQISYLLAISYTNAGTTTVLQMLNTVFVLFWVCLRARRLPRVTEGAAVVLALVATVLICTKGDLSTLQLPLVGLAWGLLSAVCVAFYVLYPKRLIAQWGTVPVTGLGMLFGFVLSLVALFAGGGLFLATDGTLGMQLNWPQLDLAGVLALAAIVFVGTAASFGLYLHGVSIVGGVPGSLLGALEPVAASVFAVLWMGTVFTWADWVGMALMIGAVALVSIGQGEQVQGQGN